VYFPRMLAPIAALLATTVELLITLFPAHPGTCIRPCGASPSGTDPPAVDCRGNPAGHGCRALAGSCERFDRDVHYVLGFLLQAVITPVAFSSSLVPERWKWAYNLNPAAGLIDGMHWALLDGPSPGPQLVVSVASLSVVLVTSSAVKRWGSLVPTMRARPRSCEYLPASRTRRRASPGPEAGVGSLLDVGAGFHPELTGRENDFLSGTVMGMRRSEVRTLRRDSGIFWRRALP
jgi:hypothetical protein